MPDWIFVSTPTDGRVTTARAPFDPVTTDALVRAERSVRPGASHGSAKAQSSIYVVLLEFAADDYGLYVGRTGLTPEERYLNHKAGHRASKWVRKYGIGLLPRLYRHLNPLGYEPATRAEVALAEALRGTGIRVRRLRSQTARVHRILERRRGILFVNNSLRSPQLAVRGEGNEWCEMVSVGAHTRTHKGTIRRSSSPCASIPITNPSASTSTTPRSLLHGRRVPPDVGLHHRRLLLRRPTP